MHHNLRTRLGLLLLLGTAPLTFAHAAKSVIKEYSFDLADIDKVDVHASVGGIHIIHGTGNKVSVVLEIKQQNRHWFQSDVNLDEVELHSNTRGKRLSLRQDDEDLNIDWTLELPDVDETSIQLGVGQVEGKLGNTKVHVNLGVGDVDLRMPAETTGEVNLNTGVGEAKLRGGESRDYKHRFVSQEVEGHGSGDNSVYVKVGVGNAALQLDRAAKP